MPVKEIAAEVCISRALFYGSPPLSAWMKGYWMAIASLAFAAKSST